MILYTCNTEHMRDTFSRLRNLKGGEMAAQTKIQKQSAMGYVNRRNRFNAKKRRSISIFLPTDVLQELDVEKIRQSFTNRDDLLTAILEERYFGEAREKPLAAVAL